MQWKVIFHPIFDKEYMEFPAEVQNQLTLISRLLEQSGPQLGRPQADTLKDSEHTNMKELRFYAADGVWRIAFAFDPKRRAILLVGGDKTGVSERVFYKKLIRKADERFNEWLEEHQ
jgi:hypothetical protein